MVVGDIIIGFIDLGENILKYRDIILMYLINILILKIGIWFELESFNDMYM